MVSRSYQDKHPHIGLVLWDQSLPALRENAEIHTHTHTLSVYLCVYLYYGFGKLLALSLLWTWCYNLQEENEQKSGDMQV